jgi:outer membrane protein OmpA-like peptidoglycan-associated protein
VIRRQLVTGLVLLPLLLACGCAMQTTGQSDAADTREGIAVESLADGGLRLIIATDAAFDFGSDVLRPDMTAQLLRHVDPYVRQPGVHIVVSAYSDNVGAASYNLGLSQRRARAVADVLLAQGFTSAQLQAGGYGEDNPVASNANEAGRYRNRRVEVLITNSNG